MKKFILFIALFNAMFLIAQPFGNVAVFDGVNDFIEAPDAFGSDFDTAVSVEAWINPCVTSGYRVIASKWYCTGADNGFFFSINNGKLRFTWDTDACSNGSNAYQSNAAIIQTNVWQHVAVTHDSNGVQLYLNGNVVASSLTTGSSYSTIQTSTQKLRIGAYKIGTTLFVGKYEGLMDEVRIWKTKRTASEISSNYLTSLAGNQTNLVGYYKMNLTSSGNGVSVPNSATSTGLAVQGTTVGTASTPAFNSQDFSVISSVLGNDTLICSSSPSYTLDATTPGGTYLWNDGSTNATNVITTSSTNSVIITIGCNEYFDTSQVTFQTPPTVNLGNDTTICSGQTLVLDANQPGATYLWQDGTTGSNLTVSQAGTYSVTVTVNGCSTTDNIIVTYVAPATVNLGADQTICQGSSVILNATNPSSTYLWSTNATTPTISVNQTGIYSVEVDDYCGIVRDTVSITVNPLPVVNLGNDTTICSGQTLMLDASQPGATYLWQDGTTGSNLTVSQAGTYSVTVTVNGCSTTDNIIVTYVAPATVNLGADQTICQGNSVLLNATNPSATYLWSTNATTPTISVNQTDVYTVEVFHFCGVVKDTISVTVNPIPVVSLGNDTTLCTGQTLTLDGTISGASYTWQNGSTLPQLTVSSAGTYSVTATKANCSSTDDIIVSYVSPASVNLGADQSICQGGTVTLDATNSSSTYLWSTAATSPTISVNQTGVYSVEVDHYCGVVKDTVSITVNPLPVVDLGNDTTLCAGQTIALCGTTPGASYLWQDGSVGVHLTVSSAGTYSVTATKANCSSTDDVIISYVSPASVNLGADQTICQGSSVTLNATNSSSTYLWSTAATSPTISVNQTGVYSVEVDHYCGVVKDTVSITVNPLPVVDLGNDTTLCTGQTLTLDGTVSGASYLWQDGSVGAHLTVSSAGTYSVTATKANCSSTDDIIVSYVSPASVNLGADQTICQGSSVTLNATNSSSTYLWSTAATSPTISVNQTGVYSVEVDHYCGVVKDTVSITVNPLPVVDLGNDTTLCTGQTLTLDGTVSGASYLWQDGSVGAHLTVSSAGTYSVTATKANCSSTDDIIVSYVSPASVNLGADQTICQGSSVTLNATNSSSTYFWSTAATSPTISVNQTGVYSVEVDHYCGVVKDTVSITVNPLPVADLGNDTTLCTGQILTLDGTVSGASYLWQDGSVGAHFTVNTAGTYSVTTTKNGCSSTDDIIVSYVSPASVNLGADQSICQGGTVTLDATNPSSTYLWSTAASSPTISVNQTGVYSVEVDHYCGVVKDTVSITVNPLPVVDLGNDTTLCTGQTLTLDGTVSGASYLWQDGSVGAHFTVNTAGTYSVITTKNGCSSTDNIIVSYTDLQVDLGADLILCEGENVLLSALSLNSTYLWQDGGTSSNYNVTEPGLYFVKVNNSACEIIDSIEVKYELLNENISISINPNCGFSDLVVSANPMSNNGSVVSPLHWTIDNNYQFLGNNGEKRFTNEGTYIVEVSASSGGCQIDTSFSVYIDVFDLPEANFNASNENPDVEETVYFSNYSEEGLSYFWDFGNGETSNEFEPIVDYKRASTYSVSLTVDNNQCSTVTDMLVIVKEPLLYFIPNAFTPDGNQYNNSFMPVFTSGFDPYNYELRIYNRWGELMFISKDPNVGWDGTYRDELQDNGVYVWEVLFGEVNKSGRSVDKGTVTLLK